MYRKKQKLVQNRWGPLIQSESQICLDKKDRRTKDQHFFTDA